jgi:hypothetical protein
VAEGLLSDDSREEEENEEEEWQRKWQQLGGRPRMNE